MTLDPSSILLDGQVAVVTGASGGIGAASAIALARFGCAVAVCDRQEAGLSDTVAAIEATGRPARSIVLDVRDAVATAAWIDGIAADLGPIGVLVNNAAGTFRAPYADISLNAEASLLSENYTQVSSTIRGTLPHFPEAGGAIVNITSIEAHRAAPGFAVYAAAKAAVANLTRSLALELADRRIRINCVAPDVIPTPGLGPAGDEIRRAVEAGEAHQPWPEVGSADDCAAAVVFLAGPMSRFVTGSTIHVDGGTHASGGWRRSPAKDGTYIL